MKKAKVIAFYLPQYYPTKENDEWYGKGYTEWTNVGKAKPLFKGHNQPRVPADLGYYDLRIPEVRQAQADLAKEAGIEAFCYYHYWFGNGKEMLEMPLKEIVRLKEPDFPFCIAWANHTWYRKTWDVSKNVLDKEPIVKQEYPGKDDIKEHFMSLLPMFKDKRYYRIKNKLVFVLYRIENIPDCEGFMDYWRLLAKEFGLPDFHFISYADDKARLSNKAHTKCDATALSMKSELDSLGTNAKIRKITRFTRTLFSQWFHTPLSVYKYKDLITKLADPLFENNSIYPVLFPNWDNTPRRGYGSLVIKDATPELFKKHAQQIFQLIENKPADDKIVFLKSWNEWGEGNYMEPDILYGKGYIEALHEALFDTE